MKISIAICTHNRFHLLQDLLSDLQYQVEIHQKEFNSSCNFELIVVDNNSTDETQSLKNFKLTSTKFVYLKENKPGLSSARNLAIKKFKGDLICFLDDDILLTDNFIENCVIQCSKRLSNTSSKFIIGGKVEAFLDSNNTEDSFQLPVWLDPGIRISLSSSYLPCHNFGSLEKNYPFHYGRKNIQNPIGACFIVSREVFKTVDSFNEDIGIGALSYGQTLHEDTEFFRLASKEGITLEYIPSLAVKHRIFENRLEHSYIYNWYFRSGKSLAILSKTKPEFFNSLKHALNYGIPACMLRVWRSSLNFKVTGIPFYMHVKLLIVYFSSILAHLSFKKRFIVFFKAQFYKVMGEIAGMRSVV